MGYLYILVISFIPMLIKGILHVQGGSYAPMIVINLLALPVIFGLYKGKAWVTFFIKAWAAWLMVYGFFRILLQVLVNVTEPGVEANIMGQLTIGYFLFSLLHMLVGWGLNRYLYSCVWVASKPEPRLA